MPIQKHLIGVELVRNGQQLHEALANSSAGAGLLSPTFLDAYLPTQPNLLLALLVLLIAIILSLLLVFVMLMCRYRCTRLLLAKTSTSNSTQQDEKVVSQQHSHRRLRALLFITVPLWLLLLFGTILFASSLLQLVSMQSADQQDMLPIAVNEALLMEEEENTNDEEFLQREQRENNNNNEDEQQMLRKFEVIRELGYQFHSLLSPALLTGSMAFVLFALLFLFLCSLLFSLLSILIGLNQRFRHYSPMERISTKHFRVRAQRIRRLLVGTGTALLCASPAMIALSATLLVHAHGHSAVCEMEQRMNQDAHILAHVHANFAPDEERTLSLPEFLAEFANERAALNREHCERERAPLQSMWTGSTLLAVISAPLGCGLLLMAAGWDANWAGSEGSVSLRAYVPGWLQNATLTPDSYSSIPELHGTGYSTASGRHPSGASASQCAFGTGTFVYKKY